MTGEQRTRLRRDIIEQLRQQRGTVTDRELACRLDVRLDWIRDAIENLAGAGLVTLRYRPPGDAVSIGGTSQQEMLCRVSGQLGWHAG